MKTIYSGIPDNSNQDPTIDPFKACETPIDVVPFISQTPDDRLAYSGSDRSFGIFQINPPGVYVKNGEDWVLIGQPADGTGSIGGDSLLKYSEDKSSLYNNIDATDIIDDVGDGAVHLGIQNKSAGSTDSIVVGKENNSEGMTNAISFGTQNRIGSYGISIGIENTASSGHTVVIGKSNYSVSPDSCLIGSGNIGFGDKYILVGNNNTGNGSTGVAYGIGNKTDSGNGLNIGFYNTSSNSWSSVLGNYNVSTGQNAVAVGTQNTSSAASSNAFGFANYATNVSASAFGVKNVASGTGSNAFGHGNLVGANNSTVIGSNITTVVNGTVEIGYWSSPVVRAASVRLNETGDVSFTVVKTDTPKTDGGATAGSELNGALMRSAISFRVSSTDGLIVEYNDGGVIKTLDIGNLT